MLTMVAVATSCVSIGNHSKQYCCPTDSTRQNQVICSIWSSYSIHFLLATPSHPKSVPWTQKMMLTHCIAATLGFNVCRGTRITETKRTAITGHPHNPSIHIYICACENTSIYWIIIDDIHIWYCSKTSYTIVCIQQWDCGSKQVAKMPSALGLHSHNKQCTRWAKQIKSWFSLSIFPSKRMIDDEHLWKEISPKCQFTGMYEVYLDTLQG